jgi:acyl-[acyl-carrier-protein]-phospholipid O-acyltransferase / long-chain-fatty-acid--[acyl-carrier-protein] ligase
MSKGKYSDLLKSWGFQAFLWTQFLEAFNDNVFKFIIIMTALDKAPGQGSLYVALAQGAFILPFLFFSGYSGWLADIYSKRVVMIAVKLFEILSMVLGYFAMVSGNLYLMLGVVFLLGLHSTFFSPAKYGFLPEAVPEEDLSRANGLLEMTTFMAIILGTFLGGVLFSIWKGDPGRLNLVLIAVAVVGAALSLGITKVKPSGAKKAFKLNPFHEVWEGLRDLRKERAMWLTVIGISYFWLLGAFMQGAIPLLGKDVLRMGDSTTGILGTFLALGIGFGSLWAGRLSGDRVELGLIPVGSIGMGAFSMLLFALCRHSFYGTFATLALLGLSGGLYAVPLNALLQQRAEKEEKGRVIATNNFFNTIGVLIAAGLTWLLGGPLRLSPDQSILVMGVLSLLGTAYILSILPDFFLRFVLWAATNTLYRVKAVGLENLPKEGPALLVCNHISWVDGLLVGTTSDRFVRFMVYKPIYENPWLHWLFKKIKAIPTSNRTKEDVVQCIEAARQRLREGELVCIFAEGGITPTGNLMPFKRGLERIMEGVEAPIIPVHLDRLWGSVFSFKDGRFFFKWPRQIPYPVTVSFGKPLSGTSRAEEVRGAVLELGSDAVAHRKTPGDVLPYRFIKTARRSWFSLCMADSTGRELTFGKALTAGILLSGWVKKNCPEDKVGLLLPSSIGGALANLGVSLSGKAAVNLNFTAGKEAMDYAVKECGLGAILTSKVFLAKAGLEEREGMVFLEDLMRGFSVAEKALAALQAFLLPSFLLGRVLGLHRMKPDGLAAVIFSSGSTGIPKGVMLSHYNILSNLEAIEQVFWVTNKDCVLGILPFFHSFGYTGTLWMPLVGGFGVAYHPNPLDAKAVGELVGKYKVTLMIATPTFYSTYLRKVPPEQFASLRFAVVGAEKLREPIARDFKEKYGLDLLEGYGATEMSPVVSVNMPEFDGGINRKTARLKPGTVGHPLPGVAVKVVDSDTGEVLGSNKEGLLLVKGPNRMLGYLNQPERTAGVFRDGWYATGDIALVDDDGFIKITDRLSRFSKIGGEMVPHLRVEEALMPWMGEYTCAVTSVPDEQKGERLVVLYTHPGLKPAELWEKLCQTDLPKLWVPKKDSFYFVESIPFLGSGKLDLKSLKNTAAVLAGA